MSALVLDSVNTDRGDLFAYIAGETAMRLWQDEMLSRMRLASTEQQLFEVAKVEAQRIGFNHCAYGLRLPLRLTEPKTMMLNTYSFEWQQRYISEGYLAIDPTVRHGSKSLIPLVWTEDVFSKTREFWEDARAHGLRYGWAQSCIDMQGIRGMLTLARCTESLSEEELKENGYQMVWLTQVVHLCMCDLISARMLPETAIRLSVREKDVLRWSAEGKTSGEIADIINITERTVNFHIAKSMEKLNCVNKTAATVKAALLGLLI